MLMRRQPLLRLLSHDQDRIGILINSIYKLAKNFHMAKYNKY